MGEYTDRRGKRREKKDKGYSFQIPSEILTLPRSGNQTDNSGSYTFCQSVPEALPYRETASP